MIAREEVGKFGIILVKSDPLNPSSETSEGKSENSRIFGTTS
jgi:hypothetical protein